MDWLSVRWLRWWMLLAAHALPHVPVPAVGTEFSDDDKLVAEGRTALLIWAGVSLGLLVLGHWLFAVAYVWLGWSKLRRWDDLARKAGYRPSLL